MKTIIRSAAALLAIMASPALFAVQVDNSVHTSITCQFPTRGVVTVEWDSDGAWIIANDVRHPASSGSYFYQTTDDAGIVMMFGPGARMERWTFQDGGHQPEDATTCVQNSHGDPS